MLLAPKASAVRIVEDETSMAVVMAPPALEPISRAIGTVDESALSKTKSRSVVPPEATRLFFTTKILCKTLSVVASLFTARVNPSTALAVAAVSQVKADEYSL